MTVRRGRGAGHFGVRLHRYRRGAVDGRALGAGVRELLLERLVHHRSREHDTARLERVGERVVLARLGDGHVRLAAAAELDVAGEGLALLLLDVAGARSRGDLRGRGRKRGALDPLLCLGGIDVVASTTAGRKDDRSQGRTGNHESHCTTSIPERIYPGKDAPRFAPVVRARKVPTI